MADAERELLWLRRVRDLVGRLAQEPDPRRLLPLILDAAIELTEAERGFLVRVSDPKGEGGYKIRVEAARGFDRATLKSSQGNVSRTVVKEVLEERPEGLVTSRHEDLHVLDASSVRDRRVLSIISVPLRLRGEVRGVLYLDHRFRADAFREEDLPTLRTFADQAALALETAELRAAREQTAAELGRTRGALEDLIGLEPTPPPPRGVGALRFGKLVGGAPAMQQLYREIERAAGTGDPVLILGESGTGKELVAREVHARSARAGAPFLSENCAAVTESLLESELFGHRRGAFTGATSDREGLFQLAGEGTLFLDEVGDMSPSMQSKLLRVLQEGQVRPVGAEALVPVSCRVLTATHRDLRAMVQEARFREDLFFRLDVQRISVPPLRTRSEDVPLLLSHFFEQLGARGLELTPRALELLQAYPWPGNVRELENEARRLVALGLPRIGAQELSDEVQRGRAGGRPSAGFAGKTLEQVGREMIEAALRDCGGNKAQAARLLGIPRSTLYHLLERHGLA